MGANRLSEINSDAILVVGATGMLGHALVRGLAEARRVVWGTVRGIASPPPPGLGGVAPRIIGGVDTGDFSTIERAFDQASPRVVINSIGIVKQSPEASDAIRCIEVNALLPHRLARLCRSGGARLIHLSTDCVFSGRRGQYREGDIPDPEDVYGRSKLLGEVEGPGVLTLRTSIIGHETETCRGLLEWLLSQRGEVQGFARAVYSGFPTCEVVRIISKHVLNNPTLEGLYHVSSAPISKYDLLGLIARVYRLEVVIRRNDAIVCDRSLVSERFRTATSYVAPSWPELVTRMHRDHLAHAPQPAVPSRC